MSTNKNLFKEAIADAKAVREAALINAKAALEEAITPRLQSMLSAKLQEMDNDEDLTESEDDDLSENQDELDEDFDLASILHELDDDIDEAKGDDKKDDKPKSDSKPKTDDKPKAAPAPKKDDSPADDSANDDLDGGFGPEEDEKTIGELTVSEFTALIQQAIAPEGDGMGDMGMDEPGMDNPLDGDGIETDGGLGAPGGQDDLGGLGDDEHGLEETDFDLEELMNELDALEEENGGAPSAKGNHPHGENRGNHNWNDMNANSDAGSNELREAVEVIKTLRAELNEQSLLTAKLSYIGNLLKAKNLTENQKIQVVAKFDKAKTPKEAKAIYEALTKTLSKPSFMKKSIKESLGFASKPLGNAPKRQIIESNDVMSRMQKLANIK